jgi:subtilisin-like proprotein convertase family protein
MKKLLQFLLLVCAAASAEAQSVQRVPAGEIASGVYRYSGVLWNEFGQGSATVVRHPRIAASAAHVVYDDYAFVRESAWLGRNYFAIKHHSRENPANSSAAKPLRGFWSFSNYGGSASEASFHTDFVVHYAYEELAGGGFAAWGESNSNTRYPLNLAAPKLLVGYPSSDSYFMNRTGPFTSRFRRSYGMHLWNADVAVVSGMSGGGAFFQSPTSGEYLLGGVIVSGNPRDGAAGSGVRAIDASASRLMSFAMQSAVRTSAVTRSVTHDSPVRIPDNSRNWTIVRIPVSGLPSRIEEVLVSLSIAHEWIGDLEVVLRSPARRTVSLHRRQGRGLRDLRLDDVLVSSSLRGTSANGNWELLVRDLDKDDTGTLNSVALTITGR